MKQSRVVFVLSAVMAACAPMEGPPQSGTKDGGAARCIATTCSFSGKNCGTIDDGCGGTLFCGTCTQSGETCGGGGQDNVCGDGTCVPNKCGDMGFGFCGVASDGCGDILLCNCPDASMQCISSMCQAPTNPSCTPKTCADKATGWCGSDSDGCGGTLVCSCDTTTERCVDNACQPKSTTCTPKTCADKTSGWCGSDSDGCGGTLVCSCDTTTERCVDNACEARCTPTYTTCSGWCGSFDNGCGTTLDCGDCTVGTCNETSHTCQASSTDAGGNPDAESTDTGEAEDTGVAADAGTVDSGTRDSGTTDSGSRDAGTADSGTRDSGTTDSGSRDAGTRDSGSSDSGTCPEGEHPNTSGGCTAWTISTVVNTSVDYLSMKVGTDDVVRFAYYESRNPYYMRGTSWDAFGYSQTVGTDTGDRGKYVSLALDDNNLPHFSYYDATNNRLLYKAANKLDTDGTVDFLTAETPDSGGSANFGQHSSLALVSKNPRIAYYDATNNRLKYISGTRRSSGTIDWNTPDVVDSSGNVGHHASLALYAGDNNRARIAYYDVTNANLKFAYWDGSSWKKSTVDSAGDVGDGLSMALDNVGRAHIAYYDRTNTGLKYAIGTKLPDGSMSWLVATVYSDGDAGQVPSLVLDPAQRPHISHYDSDNHKVLYTTLTGPNRWATGVVASLTSSTVANDTAIVFVPGSVNPVRILYDADTRAKLARW